MSSETIQLHPQEPFSKGGNRLCFVHPDDPNRCLKVFQERGRPKQRRVRKGLLGYFRPLSAFDENLQEFQALSIFHHRYPVEITRHLPMTYGLVKTDLGLAHAMELIRDNDGKISQTLEQYIWEHGLDEPLISALKDFKSDWGQCSPNTRDLLPHNLLVRKQDVFTLFLIDGYGRHKRYQRVRIKNASAQRRIARLEGRIESILESIRAKEPPKPRIHQIKRSL